MTAPSITLFFLCELFTSGSRTFRPYGDVSIAANTDFPSARMDLYRVTPAVTRSLRCSDQKEHPIRRLVRQALAAKYLIYPDPHGAKLAQQG